MGHGNDEEHTFMGNLYGSSGGNFNEIDGGFEGIHGVGSDKFRNSAVRRRDSEFVPLHEDEK